MELNKIANQVYDLLEKAGAGICVTQAGLAFHKNDVFLHMGAVERTKAYDMDRPPIDFDEFLNQAVDVFVVKDRDYKSRFMRQLVKLLASSPEEATGVWKWETEKKLDRIRTWAETGRLAVEGEGVANSVVDAFNYTIQYLIFVDSYPDKDPFAKLNERDFYAQAVQLKPLDCIAYWQRQGLLLPDETAVVETIKKYMGANA
jgi:hypothetical protein